MRVIDCEQGSEEWEAWRMRPTASEFGRIVTPVKGEYSKQATLYACELVAKMLGVYTEPPPSYWMEWGTENEPNAVAAYEAMNRVVATKVGFVMPDDTETFGGSPDRLVGDTGLLEVKCPKPETLVKYAVEGGLPVGYKAQVQGLLLITGREWCDFFVWHPALRPYQVRVEPEEKYQANLVESLASFLEELERVKSVVKKQSHGETLYPNVEEIEV